jgi:hypothetical protein
VAGLKEKTKSLFSQDGKAHTLLTSTSQFVRVCDRIQNKSKTLRALRGITNHFYCFVCDEYVSDCVLLIQERLTATRIEALLLLKAGKAFDSTIKLLILRSRPKKTSICARRNVSQISFLYRGTKCGSLHQRCRCNGRPVLQC